MSIIIEIANKDDLQYVSSLSKEFEKENICYGLIGDEIDHYYDYNVFVAKIDNKIIGYAYGSFNVKDKDSCSFYKKGDKCFYLEEIYVKNEFRNIGAGSLLFKAIERYAKENKAKWFELSTSTKNYEEVFNFYIKMMKLNYWSSYLIKEL